MMEYIKKYKIFLGLFVVNVILLFTSPEIGKESFSIVGDNLKELLMVVPPIFILLGLLDVWVEKETMVKYMGEGSGIKGVLLGFFMGSAAAGPLYAAFPVAKVLLAKRSKISNVLVFIGAWSTTKIPLLLFEASALGTEFTITRFLLNLPVIAIIAIVTERLMSKNEIEELYESVEID